MKSSKVPNRTDSCKFPKRRPNVRQAKLKKIQKLPTWKASKQNNVDASPGNNYRYKETKRVTIQEMTFEQYLAKTSMEEIQELLGNCRKFDFPVPRNADSKAYIARDSPSLSLYLQMQKFLSDELDHCCEVLLNDRKITGFLQGCHVVNTTMMASAVLVHSWKCKVPTSQMFSTLESTQNGERLFQIAVKGYKTFQHCWDPNYTNRSSHAWAKSMG